MATAFIPGTTRTPRLATAGVALAFIFCTAVLPAFAAQGGAYGPGATQAPPAYQQQQLPSTLTLGAGTIIVVRTSQLLSSDQNRPGDIFNTVLEQPLVSDGWVVARRGQTVLGRVAVAQRAGRARGTSQLGVELTQLVLVDGQQPPIRTQLMQAGGGTSYGRDVETVGTTTGMGAVIGAIAGRGEGAGIGAAIGAAAGVAGVLLSRGRPTVIPPETQLTFQLEYPVIVSTVHSAAAFLPVTQQDYQRPTFTRRTQYLAVPPYPPQPVYYPTYPIYAAPVYYPPYPMYYWSTYYYPLRYYRSRAIFRFDHYRVRPRFERAHPRHGRLRSRR